METVIPIDLTGIWIRGTHGQAGGSMETIGITIGITIASTIITIGTTAVGTDIGAAAGMRLSLGVLWAGA